AVGLHKIKFVLSLPQPKILFIIFLGLMKYSMLRILVIYCYTMNNKYYKRSKITEAKFRHIIKCFAMDPAATEPAELSRISLRSITQIFDDPRGKLADWWQQNKPFKGTREVDEAYFGPSRIPRKRGRGAGDKSILSGILKRQGNVH